MGVLTHNRSSRITGVSGRSCRSSNIMGGTVYGHGQNHVGVFSHVLIRRKCLHLYLQTTVTLWPRWLEGVFSNIWSKVGIGFFGVGTQGWLAGVI